MASVSSSSASSASSLASSDDWDTFEVAPAATMCSSSSTGEGKCLPRPVQKANQSSPAQTPKAPASASAASSSSSGTTTFEPSAADKAILESISPRAVFIKNVEHLLTSISAAFPKCLKTKMALVTFRSYYKNDVGHQEDLIRLWHKTLKPYHDDIMSNDRARHALVVSAKIDIFESLELPKKWHAKKFGEQCRTSLVQQIVVLNKHAQTFCGFHTKFSNSVLNAASDIQSQIASGEIKEEDLTMEQLMARGMSVAEGMSEEDLMHVTENLPALMKQMGGKLGSGGVAGLGALAGGGSGAMDLSSLMALLGGKK